MVQQVDVDGQIHEFPDEATPEMMQAALRKEAARQQFMDLTTNGILDRPIKKLGADAWGLAKDIGNTVLEGAPPLINQLISKPGKTAKNIGAGLSSIPFNVGNAFLNIPQYVVGLESKSGSDWLKSHTPVIPTEGIVNATFGEPTQEEAKIRNLAALAPILGPLGKGLGKGAASVVKGGASKVLGKTDAALEANEALLGGKVDTKAAELEQKTAAAQAAEEANKEAIAQSKQEIGKSDADLMQYNVNKRQQDIQNMTDEASQLQKQLQESKPGETELPQAEENLARSQEHLENAAQLGNDVDSNIGQYLNIGAQHDVRAAQGLSNRVNAIEDYWNKAYKTFTNNIADANFQMPKSAMEKLDYDAMSPTQLIQTFGNDAFEALKKGKMDEFIKKQKVNDVKQAQGNNPYLQTLMEVAPTITDTNAADFLAKYKDFRDRAFKLSQRLRDPRVEELEKQKMQTALTEARKMQMQMKEVLDAGLGEFKPEFERVNKGYSEQVYPLRENPVVQNAQEGKLSDNIIKSLRTNQEGMPLVREIVKQDPELLRNVVGQRYFTKPKELHNPNETMREYLDEMPELKQLLAQRQNANTALEQAKSNAEMAKQHHEEVSARNVEAAKTQKKLDDMQADIESHKKEIAKLEKHIDSLKKTAQRKNISLKEKIQTEKELKELRRQLKETSIKLDEKTTGLKKYLRAAKMIYRGGKFITTGS